MADDPKHWLGKVNADPCLRYSSIIFLFGVNVLSITALSIGLTFQGQCSIEQNIAIYLIVGGFLFTLYYTFLLVILCVVMRSNASDVAKISKRKIRVLSISICIMCLFMTIWLIVGCVWVYRARPTVQSFDPKRSTYCQSVLYDYSFFYCIFLFIICFTHYISFCCMARTN